MFVPKPVVAITIALLGAFAIVLVAVIYNAWDDYSRGAAVEFRNTTGVRLCYARPSCSAEIRPHTTSRWVPDSCDNCLVEIYTEDGQKLYERTAPFRQWEDAYILISEREGEFIIADSLPSP